MKKFVIAFFIFFFPSSFCRILFKFFRITTVTIGKNVKVGYSIILCSKIVIDNNSLIGHMNFIKVREIYIEGGRIKHLNFFNGDINVEIKSGAWMHSFNKITGSSLYKRTRFVLRENAIIIMHHLFNCTDDIEIGEGCCIAGSGSQFWTHSFSLGENGDYRVDGPIVIGKKNYIGARSVICAGIRTADFVTIGANTTITKNLDKPGLYVSQEVRFISWNPDIAKEKLGAPVFDNVFRKIK